MKKMKEKQYSSFLTLLSKNTFIFKKQDSLYCASIIHIQNIFVFKSIRLPITCHIRLEKLCSKIINKLTAIYHTTKPISETQNMHFTIFDACEINL